MNICLTKMVAKMAKKKKKKKKKMKAWQNKSTRISIDDEIQNILVRNPALT